MVMVMIVMVMFFGTEICVADRKQACKLVQHYESSQLGSEIVNFVKKLGDNECHHLDHLDGDKEWEGEGANDEKYGDNPEIQQL